MQIPADKIIFLSGTYVFQLVWHMQLPPKTMLLMERTQFNAKWFYLLEH